MNRKAQMENKKTATNNQWSTCDASAASKYEKSDSNK